jgi:hypothetical protein
LPVQETNLRLVRQRTPVLNPETIPSINQPAIIPPAFPRQVKPVLNPETFTRTKTPRLKSEIKPSH